MRKQFALVGAIAVVGVTAIAAAAPLINVTMWGRVAGSGGAFTSVVEASPGDVIEYEFVADMAPVGTTNTQGVTARTITSLTPGTDGVNSLRFNAVVTSGGPISFNGPSTLVADWVLGIGPSGGVSSSNKIENVRPIRATGSFAAIDPTVVATGTLVTGVADNSVSLTRPTSADNGSLKINGATTILVTAASESGTDPIVGFSGMTIRVPDGATDLLIEPATGLSSAGGSGGPFTPASQDYTLTDPGTVPLSWTAAATQSWVSLSKSSGTLQPGGSDTVTVSINSNALSLPAGTYTDLVTFTNIGVGIATRSVTLTITVPSVVTGFTYQGQLRSNNLPAQGSYDFRFSLYGDPSGGNSLGSVYLAGVAVDKGLFTVQLDFGHQFGGQARWLEVAVQPSGGSSYTTLSPRQALTATPYALYALGPWASSGTTLSYTGGSVGIGTASPEARLDVRAGGGVDALFVEGATVFKLPDGGGRLRLGCNPNDDSVYLEGFNRDSLTSCAAMHLTGKFSEQMPYLRLHAGKVEATGNVGIGTSTPGFPLSFSDQVGDKVSLFGQSGSTYGFGVQGCLFQIHTDQAGADIAFGYGSSAAFTETMRIKGTGKVGIGVSNPTARLEIGGTPGTDGIKFPDGTIQTTAATPGSTSWSLAGNAGTTPGTYFLGTTDNQPLEIKVYGQRALRIEPSNSGRPNILAGHSSNTAGSGVYGAAIGGGEANTVSGSDSAVGGGYQNTVSGSCSAVGGGYQNTAPGSYSAVSGGYANQAGGHFSFAAGRRAKVRTSQQAGDTDGDQGTFVWADTTEADFTSTGPNQFLIRASGNVGINTNAPEATLSVAGTLKVDQNDANDGTAPAIKFGSGNTGEGIGSKRTAGGNWAGLDFYTGYSPRMSITGPGKVGIGTTSPSYLLQLASDSAGKPNGGSWANSSDARLKKNIRPLTGALEQLTQLRGVTFEWINPADHAGQTGTQTSFVAQEVEQVFPAWVSNVAGGEHDKALTPDGQVKSLCLPFHFDALVVEAIKEQQKQVEELKRDNDSLRAENADIRAQLAALAAEVRKLKTQTVSGQ